MLAHDLIRADSEIIDLLHNKTYTSNEINNYTQYLKHRMYEKLNGDTLNKIIFIDTNKFLVVVCSMKAAWELGASIFLNDVDPKIKSLPYFKNFYNVIDLVLGTKDDIQRTLPEKYILIDDYDSQSRILCKEFTHSVPEITSKTVAYYATSSGTTGDPKILPFTHYQTVTLSNAIHQYLDIKETDLPFHYKTLHHGSLFNSFSLPMLSTCKTNYCGAFQLSPDQFLTKILDIAKNNKANYFLLPYSWIRDFKSVTSADLENLATFITIQGNTSDEMKDLFDRFSPKQVINYFGCSEVGTMFISRTNKDNVYKYNPNRFHDIIPHIDYEILSNTVKCKWKHIDQWFVLADKMIREEDGSIWHHGREIAFTIDDQTLILRNLGQLIEEEIGTNQFTIVPDHIQQKLYLALYKEDLSTLGLEKLNIKIQQEFSPVFFISDIYRFDPSDLLFGMKISGPLLLYLFRQRKNQE
jgi:hypothetical protein